MDKRAKDKLIRSPWENWGGQEAQKIFTQELEGTRRRGRPRKGWKEEVERDLQVLEVRRWREMVIDREKWKGIFSTGQSPQWAVVPMEEKKKCNQQDATLYNILYYCQSYTCVRRFLSPSSGAQNSTHSIWYMSNLLAATASMGELKITHASGSSSQVWHTPDAVCRVLSSWWWAKKPSDTCRALTVIKNIV